MISLSFVVPVFGTENLLRECIDSIISCCHEVQYEIILVDDNSPGNVHEIFLEYSKSVPIKYVRHNENKGLFQARLTGFNLARGQWITSIDSDDYFVDIDFSKVLETAEENGVDIYRIPVLTGPTLEEIPDDLKNWVRSQNFILDSHSEIWEWFTSDMHWAMHGTIYNSLLLKKALGLIDQTQNKINSNEDLIFNSAFFYLAKTIQLAWSEGFYFYRSNPSSMVRQSWSTHSKVENVVISIEKVRRALNYFYEKACVTTEERIALEKANSINIDFILKKGKSVFFEDVELLNRFAKCYNQQDFILNVVVNNKDLVKSLIANNSLPPPITPKEIKNIAMVVCTLSNGGAERCASILGKLFSEECNYKVHYITGYENSDYPIAKSAVRVNIPYGSDRLLKLTQYLKTQQIDLTLFVDHWQENVLEEALISKLLGILTICMEHSSFFFPIFDKKFKLFKARESVYRLIDGVSCLSLTDEAIWRSRGVSTVRYIPNPSVEFNEKRSLTYSERNKLVVFAGRICEIKGSDFLADVIKKIIDLDPKISFAICGRFENKVIEENFREAISEEKYSKQILHLGFTKNVSYFMRTALVHIMLSRIEGSPMVIGEARNEATPTVLFAHPNIDISDRGCIHVPFGDVDSFAKKVVQLINDKNEWNLVSKDCKTGLEQWSQKYVIKEWKTFIGDIVSRKQATKGGKVDFPVALRNYTSEVNDVIRELEFQIFKLNEIQNTTKINLEEKMTELTHERQRYAELLNQYEADSFKCRINLEEKMTELTRERQRYAELLNQYEADSFKCRRYDLLMRYVDFWLPHGTLRRKTVASVVRKILGIIR